jgi:hypothetical protein
VPRLAAGLVVVGTAAARNVRATITKPGHKSATHYVAVTPSKPASSHSSSYHIAQELSFGIRVTLRYLHGGYPYRPSGRTNVPSSQSQLTKAEPGVLTVVRSEYSLIAATVLR